MSDNFRQYRRTKIAEMRPYVPGEDLGDRVSISAPDREAGSPKLGDQIARNPKNHDDQWLVAKQYFEDNFEPLYPMAAAREDDRMIRDSRARHNEEEHRKYCEAHGLPYEPPATEEPDPMREGGPEHEKAKERYGLA